MHMSSGNESLCASKEKQSLGKQQRINETRRESNVGRVEKERHVENEESVDVETNGTQKKGEASVLRLCAQLKLISS